MDHKYRHPIFEKIAKKRKTTLESHKQYLEKYRAIIDEQRLEMEKEKAKKENERKEKENDLYTSMHSNNNKKKNDNDTNSKKKENENNENNENNVNDDVHGTLSREEKIVEKERNSVDDGREEKQREKEKEKEKESQGRSEKDESSKNVDDDEIAEWTRVNLNAYDSKGLNEEPLAIRLRTPTIVSDDEAQKIRNDIKDE